MPVAPGRLPGVSTPGAASWRRATLAAWGCAGLFACDPGAEPVATPADPGPREARRVVSLAPVASRFVLALGAAQRLVGIDAESARIPELAGLPVVDLSGAAALLPDLALVPGDLDPADPRLLALRESGAEVTEFAPHDLEEVFALSRSAGAALVGTAAALRFETDLGRPLAEIGGSSFGMPRPRVLAVVGLDPLELAGGHSFETDLIEIAGGRSVTHGGDDTRLALRADQLDALAPDLVLVVTPRPATAAQRDAARAALPRGLRLEFVELDPERFWLDAPVEAAQRLRAVIEPLSREIDGAGS